MFSLSFDSEAKSAAFAELDAQLLGESTVFNMY